MTGLDEDRSEAWREAAARLEKNKKIAVGLLDAMAHGDKAEIDRLLSPKATWWVIGYGEFDRATLLDMLTRTLDRATERRHTVLGVTAEGDRVAVESESEFHFPERIYRNSYHDLLFIEGDQVIRVKEYLDPRASAGEI